MLNGHERAIWDDIERSYATETYDVPRNRPDQERTPPGPRRLEDLPVVFSAGLWIGILLVVFGYPLIGGAVGAAIGVALLPWYLWPRPGAGKRWQRIVRWALRDG